MTDRLDVAGLVERTKRRAAAKRMMAFTSQAHELDELASALTELDERVKLLRSLEKAALAAWNVAEDRVLVLDERVKELQEAYDKLTGERFSDRVHAALKSRAETAEAENERLAKDAARYRWLRAARKDEAAQGSCLIRMGKGCFTYELPSEDELDAAIDAALASGKGAPGVVGGT